MNDLLPWTVDSRLASRRALAVGGYDAVTLENSPRIS